MVPTETKTAIAVASVCLCLGLQFLSVQTHAASIDEMAPRTITIVMTNDAVVTPPVLQSAEQVASRIFRDAGIELRWTQDITVDPRFSIAMHATEGQHRAATRQTEGPFARTLRTRHVLGGRTSVFYDRVLRHALATHRSLTGLLGTVMAHEIGHMLLPDMQHSASGLMRSGWDDEDLTHAVLGALHLTREQVDQILARLSQRPALPIASLADWMRQ